MGARRRSARLACDRSYDSRAVVSSGARPVARSGRHRTPSRSRHRGGVGFPRDRSSPARARPTRPPARPARRRGHRPRRDDRRRRVRRLGARPRRRPARGCSPGLAIAAFVAFANAGSTAQLAARYPESGGAYRYGRERLGPWPGFLAGWGFVIGKTASCAAMAITAAAYLVPAPWQRARRGRSPSSRSWAVNLLGVTRTARVGDGASSLAVARGARGRRGGRHRGVRPAPRRHPSARSRRMPRARADAAASYGVLQSAGLLFFAFAGYARIATLGEEVRDPARTIPRAIAIALSASSSSCTRAVGIAALGSLGPARLAASDRPARRRRRLQPAGRGPSRSCGSPRASPRSAPCSRSSRASAARASRWRAIASCRRRSPRCIRGSGCRTSPRSRWAVGGRRARARRRPARRDRVLARSACCSTTSSRTPRRSRSRESERRVPRWLSWRRRDRMPRARRDPAARVGLGGRRRARRRRRVPGRDDAAVARRRRPRRPRSADAGPRRLAP